MDSSVLSPEATSAKSDSLLYSVNEDVGGTDVRHPCSSSPSL